MNKDDPAMVYERLVRAVEKGKKAAIIRVGDRLSMITNQNREFDRRVNMAIKYGKLVGIYDDNMLDGSLGVNEFEFVDV